MKILGVVIAGGTSSRMGGREKAFIELDGVNLMERTLSRLSFQVDDVAINANGDAGRFAGSTAPYLRTTSAMWEPHSQACKLPLLLPHKVALTLL